MTDAKGSIPAKHGTQSEGDGLVVVARTIDEVEQLRSRWEQMSVSNIDADIDYFLAVVRHDPTVVRPHVLLIERSDKPPLLTVARLVYQEYPLDIGYRKLVSPAALTVLVALDGVIGLQDQDDVATVITALSRHLAAGEADVLRFQKVDTASLLHEGAKQAVGWLRRSHGVRPTVNWWATVPGSWEEFLATRSSKLRRRIRYDDRRFQEKYLGDFEIRRLDAPEFRDRLRADLEAVARTSYQRRLKTGFDLGPLWEGLVTVTLDRDWLRVWMLYIHDRPVAFWWGTAYAGVFADYSPGYDPEFGSDRVGSYTMLRMLKDLCDDGEVSLFDHGHGEADYKRRFGTHSTNTADVLIFARRPRPLVLNAIVSFGALTTGAAKDLIARSERLKNLQRRIRSRARRQRASSSGT